MRSHKMRCRASLPSRALLLAATGALTMAGCGMAADSRTPGAGPTRLEIVIESSLSPLAGETAKLRAAVDRDDFMVVTYDWQVVAPDDAELQPALHDGDARRVSLLLDQPGTYSIRCTAALASGGSLVATAALTASSAGVTPLTYTARIYPPPALGAPPVDLVEQVAGSDKRDLLWVIHEGVEVELAVERADGAVELLPSFVRLVGAGQHSLPRDLFLDTGKTRLRLTGSFDALFVPESQQVAPALRRGLDAASLGAVWRVELDAGELVEGTVRGSDGLPLAAATVTLHARDAASALPVPSTVGQTDAAGAFAIRGRWGAVRLIVVPPADSSYPLATVESREDQELRLDGPADSWDFVYHPPDLVALSGLVTRHDGKTPASNATVIVRSGPLTGVGVLQVGDATFEATGRFRRTLRSDAAGRIVDPTRPGDLSFDVPRGTYQVVLVPGADEAPHQGRALHEVAIEPGSTSQVVQLELAGRVPLSGTVYGFDGAPISASLSAHGPTGDFFAETDADGEFDLDLDDQLTYSLVIRPSAHDGRVDLGPLLLPALQMQGARRIDKLILPRAVTLSGVVRTQGSAAVAGALIRIWCSSCATKDVVDETRSGSDGSFTLRVPRP